MNWIRLLFFNHSPYYWVSEGDTRELSNIRKDIDNKAQIMTKASIVAISITFLLALLVAPWLHVPNIVFVASFFYHGVYVLGLYVNRDPDLGNKYQKKRRLLGAILILVLIYSLYLLCAVVFWIITYYG